SKRRRATPTRLVLEKENSRKEDQNEGLFPLQLADDWLVLFDHTPKPLQAPRFSGCRISPPRIGRCDIKEITVERRLDALPIRQGVGKGPPSCPRPEQQDGLKATPSDLQG